MQPYIISRIMWGVLEKRVLINQDNVLQNTLIDVGIQRLKDFSWDKYFESIFLIYQNIDFLK